jgi:hypothetical protein
MQPFTLQGSGSKAGGQWQSGLLGFCFVLETYPPCFCLICGFCSSARNFASGFLQIPPRGGHPCLWLTLPAAIHVADFHRQVTAHAGRTKTAYCNICRQIGEWRIRGSGRKPPVFISDKCTGVLSGIWDYCRDEAGEVVKVNDHFLDALRYDDDFSILDLNLFTNSFLCNAWVNIAVNIMICIVARADFIIERDGVELESGSFFSLFHRPNE